jgi:hypothetical protein
MASRSVAVTSGFAGLSNPMWLSLICTNRRPGGIRPVVRGAVGDVFNRHPP